MHFSYGFINNHLCNNLFISRLKNMYFSCQEKYNFCAHRDLIFGGAGREFFAVAVLLQMTAGWFLCFCAARARGRKCQFAAATGCEAVAGEVLPDKVAKITRCRFGVAEIKL